jgi:glycosyltransferase involved in cell wall biosynthesis
MIGARTDLHILTHAAARRDWLEQAIASVAGHPVTLHVIENGASIGAGRARALRLGAGEFVTWIDSDDVLLPGAVQACVDALDAHPNAVAAFTDHRQVDAGLRFLRGGESTGTGPYDVRLMPYLGGYGEHLCVFRRRAVEPFLEGLADLHMGNCCWLRGMVATLGDYVHVERDGVLFRIHEHNTHKRHDLATIMPIHARIYRALYAAGKLPGGRIDCHVLHCHEPKHWLMAALASLAAEPVTVHLRPGIPGRVGAARARAFAEGDAEYVAWLDGDDEVMPGAFAAALAVLDADPGVVSTYCDIQLIDHPEGVGYIKGPWSPWRQLWKMAEVHHLHVMRRAAVMACLEELERWDGHEEYVLMGLLARFGRHHHIPRRLYRFRQHGAYPRAGAIGGSPSWRRAHQTVAPILMDLHRRGVRQHDAG